MSVSASDHGETLPAQPGQRLARGVMRMLYGLNHAALAEFVPVGGMRVDVSSVTPRGEIWVVECKSCRADFAADRKWQGYLDFCDRFFWAVDSEFPDDLLPPETGLIRADPWGAELIRMAPESRLSAARRTRLLRDIARVSTVRLMAISDPLGVSGAVS